MITINATDFKTFSQTLYNNLIDSIHFHSLYCTCGYVGNLTKHAYYTRKIKFFSSILKLSILRVKCSSCNITHAILPSFIVPYSQITISEHIEIISAHLDSKSFKPIMDKNTLVDESNVSYILSQFKKHWKERLNSFKIPFDEFIIFNAFKFFSRQFMQIKRVPNILFFPTHIT